MVASNRDCRHRWLPQSQLLPQQVSRVVGNWLNESQLAPFQDKSMGAHVNCNFPFKLGPKASLRIIQDCVL